MTSEERAAYVNAQAACAIIEALGQLAENEQRQAAGKSLAYGEEAFQAIMVRYGIHTNALLNFLKD